MLERLAGRHAVVLTPHGDFLRVQLPDAAEVQPGQEIWADEVLQGGALAAALRRAFGSWPRAFAATAVAFGAAGALFAALYFRGALSGISAPAGIQAMPGESTVDANAPPAPVAAVATRMPSAPTIRISEQIDAPRLYAPTDFGEWASLRFEGQQAAQEAHSDIVEYVRHALRAGGALGPQSAAAGASVPAGRFGSEGTRSGTDGARRQAAQAAKAREAHQLSLPVVRLGADS